MLQRINFGLMIVVLLAVVGVSVQMFMTQRSHHETLEAITTELTELRTVVTERPGGASASATTMDPVAATKGDDAADAHILIEGEIERPGWYPIKLDEAIYVHELLNRAGVHERQWVRHRPGGDGGEYKLADLYLGDDPPRVVIRPGDEIEVANEIGENIRAGFALRHAHRYLAPYDWRPIDEHGEPIENGWRIEFIELTEWKVQTRVGQLTHPLLPDQRFPARMWRRPSELTVNFSPKSAELSAIVPSEWSFDIDTITIRFSDQLEGGIAPVEPEAIEAREIIDIPQVLRFARFSGD